MLIETNKTNKRMLKIQVPAESAVSLIHGMWFVFVDGENRIALWASAVTGREHLFLNGKHVSAETSFQFLSAKEFLLNGSRYKVVLEVQKLSKASFMCTLHKDGVPVQAFVTELAARSPFALKVMNYGILAAILCKYVMDIAVPLSVWMLMLCAACWGVHYSMSGRFAVHPSDLREGGS
ncbi:hypothetical protein ACTSKR_06830 [Chitinibacteraceae bacterium HSL-7]